MSTILSVIMPTYNSQWFVMETIDSILKQTLTDFSFIIVDDGSTDNTINIIKSIDDKRIMLIEADYAGKPAVLNIAVKHSNAEFIAFIDHDDIAVIMST